MAKYGVEGSGWWEVNASKPNQVGGTSDGPATMISTWSGDNPYTSSNRADHVRTGNLNGYLGIASEVWGFAAGEDITKDPTPGGGDEDIPYFYAGSGGVKLGNIDLVVSDGSDDVIKLDYATPYFAIGDGGSLPTDYDTTGTGFWVGSDSGTYKIRVGAAGGQGMIWDGDSLSFRNSAGTEVIIFQSGAEGGNSVLRSTLLLDEAASILQASTANGSVYINTDEGFAFEHSSADSTDSEGYAVINANDEVVGGLFSNDRTGYVSTIITASPNTNSSNPDASVEIYATAKTTSDASRVYISPLGTTATTPYVIIENNGASGTQIRTLADEFQHIGGMGIDDGLYVGDDAPTTFPGVGQVVIDQGAGDYEQILFRNSDVAHGISVGTDVTTNDYGSIGKLSATGGALQIRGMNDGDALGGIGLYLGGYVLTADTDSTTSATGAVQIVAFEGTTPANLEADDNLAVFRNNLTAEVIIKGDGEIYSNQSATIQVFDEYDDVALTRTLANTLGNTIQSKWDDFVKYNADDLDRLGILTKGGMMSHQKLDMLFVGAFWQLHERIAELENKLAEVT